MIDHHGEEWLPVSDAAERLGIPKGTVYVWLTRGKVQTHRIQGRAWVNMPDLMDAEHKTRGRYVRQRGDQV